MNHGDCLQGVETFHCGPRLGSRKAKMKITQSGIVKRNSYGSIWQSGFSRQLPPSISLTTDVSTPTFSGNKETCVFFYKGECYVFSLCPFINSSFIILYNISIYLSIYLSLFLIYIYPIGSFTLLISIYLSIYLSDASLFIFSYPLEVPVV